MSLTSEQIHAAIDKGELQREKVAVPEWASNGDAASAHVHVRMLRGDELANITDFNRGLAEADTANAVAAWCVFCICDDTGVTLFTKDDIKTLMAGPLPPLVRCANAAKSLNNMAVEEDDAGN